MYVSVRTVVCGLQQGSQGFGQSTMICGDQLYIGVGRHVLGKDGRTRCIPAFAGCLNHDESPVIWPPRAFLAFCDVLG